MALLGEGLDVFQVATPKSLVGRTLAQAGIRESSRCNVLAIVRDGKTITSPSGHEVLEAGSDLILRVRVALQCPP